MNNRSINEIQDEIIEDFSQVEDWMDRYQMIIDLGEELEPIDESERTATNLIEGCQSSVWLVCEEHDGRALSHGDSNALIVKGLVSLLLSVVSNHTPQEILDADLYFIQRIGLSEHLSPTRSNGLLAMVKQIRMYALAEKELLSHRQA